MREETAAERGRREDEERQAADEEERVRGVEGVGRRRQATADHRVDGPAEGRERQDERAREVGPVHRLVGPVADDDEDADERQDEAERAADAERLLEHDPREDRGEDGVEGDDERRGAGRDRLEAVQEGQVVDRHAEEAHGRDPPPGGAGQPQRPPPEEKQPRPEEHGQEARGEGVGEPEVLAQPRRGQERERPDEEGQDEDEVGHVARQYATDGPRPRRGVRRRAGPSAGRSRARPAPRARPPRRAARSRARRRRRTPSRRPRPRRRARPRGRPPARPAAARP